MNILVPVDTNEVFDSLPITDCIGKYDSLS